MPRRSGEITVWTLNYGRAKFVLQWIDPITGKRRSKTSEFSKKRDAEREAYELEKDLNSKRPTGDGRITFDAFIEAYTERHLQSLKNTSEDRATGVLSTYENLMSPKTLANITADELSKYAQSLRDDGRAEPTIKAHMRHLRAALQWAKDNHYISDIPIFPKQARARTTRAKGRPLTDKEFLKFIFSVRHLPRKFRRTYRRLIIGLWLSGLRLDEALSLTWGTTEGHSTDHWIDLGGTYPLLGIVAEGEKGFEDRLLPITPDFGRWLLKVPEDRRTGFVFPLEKHRWKGTRTLRSVSRKISEIGKHSGVKVSAKGKTASAHDLRRTFGLRWASKVMPADLQALMRHSSIATTLAFYAFQEAESFAERLWAAEKTQKTAEKQRKSPAKAAGRTTNRTTATKSPMPIKKQNPSSRKGLC